MLKRIILKLWLLLLSISLSAQCPDRDFLWHRIIYLRDSTHVPDKEQLKELNGYLSNIRLCSYQNDSTHALLLLRTGWLYSKQKDFKKAIELTTSSIKMITDHPADPKINATHIIKCYYNLRLLYDSIGQGNLKLRAMDSCIYNAVKFKTGYDYAMQLINWEIQYYFEKGDYYRCINYTKLAEDITQKANYQSNYIYFYLIWEINSLISLNKIEFAESLIDKSFSKCVSTGNRYYLGTLIGLKAKIAGKSGDEQAAIRYSKKSLELNRKIDNCVGCYGVLNNLGFDLYFSKLHKNDKALYYYRQSLAYADKNDSINTFNNIANVFTQEGATDSAEYYFVKAFDNIYPRASIANLLNKSWSNLLTNINIEYLINLILDKADSYLIQYKKTRQKVFVNDAVQSYLIADQIMGQTKLVQTDISSKLFWRSDTRRLYENAIESCFLSDNMESAFYFFEKSRAILLTDQIKEQETGDSSVLELAAIRKKIPNLERQMTTLKSDSKEYSEIQRSLFLLKEQSGRLDQLIKERNPWYYQSLIDTNFIKIKDAQRKLTGINYAQSILEFFHGDSAIYVLFITKDKSTIIRINKDKYENLVNQYISYLSNPEKENKDYAGFIQCSQDLYQLIFSQLTLPKGRMIIFPDGKCYPLEALVTNSNISTPEYFLKDHILSYTYSVRYLLNDFTKNRTKSTGNFLGIAPITYPRDFQLASLQTVMFL